MSSTDTEVIDFEHFNREALGLPETLGVFQGRYVVEIDGMPVPILVDKKPEHDDRLLVTYNGALQRSKAPDGIIFQRSSWLDEFKSSVVQIADPTLVKESRLQIGWAQYSKERWAIEDMARVLDRVREVFDLQDASSTLHYGSSAGGFQAIAMATLDVGSRAMVNNPQLDWSRYVESFVNALRRQVFNGDEMEKIKEEAPWRVNVADLFELVGVIPEISIFTNIASSGDLDNQLVPFLSSLAANTPFGTDPKVRVHAYAHEGLGHNPLPKPKTIQIINRALESLNEGV